MATHGVPAIQTPAPRSKALANTTTTNTSTNSTSGNPVKRVTFCQSLTDRSKPPLGAAGKKNRFSADDACRDLLLEPDPRTIRAYKDRKSFTPYNGRRVRLTTSGGKTTTTNMTTTPTNSATITTPTEKSSLIGGAGVGADSHQSQPPAQHSTTTPSGDKNPDEKPSTDRFGVKSYLHQFYEGGAVVNPEKYDEIEGGWSGNGGDYRYLIRPRSHTKFRRTFWWKVAVWCGINFLVVGILVILIGNLLPRRPVVVGSPRDDLEMIDRSAVLHNNNLEVCKIVGIVLFCVGGAVIAVALLLPSFVLHYTDDIWDGVGDGVGSGAMEPPFKVVERRRGDDYGDDDENRPLRRGTTVDSKVPATQEITRIQPFFEVYDSPIVVGASTNPAVEAQSIVPLISGD